MLWNGLEMFHHVSSFVSPPLSFTPLLISFSTPVSYFYSFLSFLCVAQLLVYLFFSLVLFSSLSLSHLFNNSWCLSVTPSSLYIFLPTPKYNLTIRNRNTLVEKQYKIVL